MKLPYIQQNLFASASLLSYRLSAWLALMTVITACGSICWGQASIVPDSALSDRRVAYHIQARLDPDTKSIAGFQRVSWKNPDNVAVDELQFHLYLNAFKDTLSTFMVESGGAHRGFSATVEDPWGGITVNQMRIIGNEVNDELPIGRSRDSSVDITEQIQFIQPDDDNEFDQTVISVQLPEPVPPGESISLEIDFESKLPEIIARTGWKKKHNDSLFVLAAQWFPKLGVYEVPGQRYVPASAPSGQWSTHQFHANSEFYADFGSYVVDVTVPGHFLVGATGVKVDERVRDGYRTVRFEAHDVHDFAWTTSGDLLEFEDKWEHVNLRLFIQPEHVDQVERHFEAAKTGLAYFADWVGPYPYETLTLVDGVGGSNGMEYPTFITCGTFFKLPAWMRALELVTIHELGHQYFYGMIASNEAEEAWLDEGITSYLEMHIMDAAYGHGAVVDLPWLKVNGRDVQRLGYVANNPGRGVIYTKSWMHPHKSDYGKASYFKPATVLGTLEGYLGWDVMLEVLKTYYSRWAFNHPTTKDFIQVVEDVSGEDLGWFFDQFIYAANVVDYAVGDIEVVQNGGEFMSDFSVLKLGDGIMPLTIRGYFADGTHEDLAWNGEESKKTFSFAKDVPLIEVHIDPEDKVWLDIDRLNNRKRITPETNFAKQHLFNSIIWFQNFFQVASGVF